MRALKRDGLPIIPLLTPFVLLSADNLQANIVQGTRTSSPLSLSLSSKFVLEFPDRDGALFQILTVATLVRLFSRLVDVIRNIEFDPFCNAALDAMQSNIIVICMSNFSVQ